MIALSLGGGAALGWAHIGVLRVLQEEGIPIGAVAGTSMGALAALSLAAGRLDALEAMARGTTRRRIWSYLTPFAGRGAMLDGRRVSRDLATHFADVTLDTLPLPIALVAADLATGEEVWLSRGPAIPAVLASMALPGLFRPVTIGGRTLIDGGMAAIVPVRAARAIAPGLPLLAIDVIGNYADRARARPARPPSAFGMARSGFLMMMARQTTLAFALDPPDVALRLPVGRFHGGAFAQADELIAIGRAATVEALPMIRDKLMPTK